MNTSDCKYFCLLKGDWQERFFELIQMFQISLHNKFAIGVPENLSSQYNNIIIYGVSSSKDSCDNDDKSLTDEEIVESFYKDTSTQLSRQNSYGTVSESEQLPVNFFENQFSYN